RRSTRLHTPVRTRVHYTELCMANPADAAAVREGRNRYAQAGIDRARSVGRLPGLIGGAGSRNPVDELRERIATGNQPAVLVAHLDIELQPPAAFRAVL